MAKLPDPISLGERPRPEPMGRAFRVADISDPTGRGTAAVGEALMGAGDAVFKIENELRQAQIATQMSDALGKAATELGAKTLEFQRDPDFRTSPERFKKVAEEIGKRHIQGIGTPLEQEAFKREYGRLALSHQLNVLSGAARQEGDYNISQLDSNLEVFAQSAANAQNYLEREAIVNQAKIAIVAQRRAGWITDVDAEKRRHTFETKLDHASVLRDIGANPQATAEKLATDPSYASKLDPLSRQQLQHTALVREQQRKSHVQPVEAREDADKAMRPAGVDGLKVMSPADRLKAIDVRAQLPKWLANAEAEAEKRHPGDPVYRDLVVNRVKSYVATQVAAQEGEQRQAYVSLIGALGGIEGRKPLTQDELFAKPGMRDAYAKIEPHQQAAVLSHLNHNANEAIGKPAKLNAVVEQQVFERMLLPPDDPRWIGKPEQLAQFVAQGLTLDGDSRLRRKLEELKNPDGKGFLADVAKVNRTAHAMLSRSILAAAQPDLAEEGAYRFNRYLDQKIEEYRAAKKDPRDLLTPGKPDYVLAPERVATFLPNARQAVSDAAKSQRETAGKIGGPAAKPSAALPTYADYGKLKSGDEFTDPQGNVRKKP